MSGAKEGKSEAPKELLVEMRDMGSLRPYGKNAKKHTNAQVRAIAASVTEFGFNQPIAAEPDGTIVVGHGRYLAAKLLGIDRVPVVTLDIGSGRAKAYRLADNRLNESEWDMRLVAEELRELEVAHIDLTGFDRKLADPAAKGLRDEDDVPPIPERARSVPGDLYVLGGTHRLLCGDSSDPDAWVRLMDGVDRCGMTFTDPPYNIGYRSGRRNSAPMKNDGMDDGKFLEFLLSCFGHWRGALKDRAAAYVFHSPQTQTLFERALENTGFRIVEQLIWNKPSMSTGYDDYRRKHEPFFYACPAGQKPEFFGDRTHRTVLDLTGSDAKLMAWAKAQRRAEREGRTTVWSIGRDPVGEYVHPTQKPVELVRRALDCSSRVGWTVLDPFLGSGSTLIACQSTNRRCVGMEIDPAFVDAAVRRYLDYTGDSTVTLNGKETEFSAE